MSEQDAAAFRQWLSTYEASHESPAQLVDHFGRGLGSIGVRVERISVWLPTSHPELWGTQVVWLSDSGATVIARPHDITQTDAYLNTPGQAVYEAGTPLRFRLAGPEGSLPYAMLREFAAQGYSDYYIRPFQLYNEQAWVALVTRKSDGYSELELSMLEQLCEQFGWKVRVAVSRAATHSLLEVYLGHNAAQRVMHGQFRRRGGAAIHAAIWFCDLRGFTELSDSRPPHEIVQILDSYFETVAGPIEDAGGEILKFIGDAVMAVFPLDGNEAVICQRALSAAERALAALEQLNAAPGAPRLAIGIGLHAGEVYYGNIGGRSRLDFTVIGASVNETCRIEAQCKTLQCPLLMSSQFAARLRNPEVVSLGEHALKGVNQPRELLTLTRYAPTATAGEAEPPLAGQVDQVVRTVRDPSRLYRPSQRQLQDEFSSRALADRLEQVNLRSEFSDSDRAFIETAAFFFLGTASSAGQPSVSYKGGPPGLVRVLGPAQLAYPDYDGNGMFLSLGNIDDNPNVCLLFIDFENPRRLVVHGTASVLREDPLLLPTAGAQLMVRIAVQAIYPNCPRYIHPMQRLGLSAYVPQHEAAAPEPAWKSFSAFEDVVPKRRR